MKKSILLITVIFSFFNLNAQSVKDLQGHKQSFENINNRINHIMDSAGIAGLSVVIINKNAIVYQKAFGYKDKVSKLPLNTNTEMYAASFTKPVTSFLFLKMAEEGKIKLDTPIYKYLKKPIGEYPKWKELASEVRFKKVTPRMLLSHSSGLPILRSLYNNKLILLADPGTKFYYSNEGMNLLGFVMEEIMNMTLNKIAEKYAFQSLGMNYTSYVWEDKFANDLALGHNKSGETIEYEKRTQPRGAGSMITNASDYSKFLILLMKQRGLKRNLLKGMKSQQIAIKSERGFGPRRDSLTNKYDSMKLGWGLGIGLFQSPYGQAFFHTGNDNGWQNYFVAYPDKGIAIILMSNSNNFEANASKLLDYCIGDKYSPFEWLGYLDKGDSE